MSDLDITDLIEYCSENISRRQADFIRTDEDLLDILEKRDLIDRKLLETQQPLTSSIVKQHLNNFNTSIYRLQNEYALERGKYEEEVKLIYAKSKLNIKDDVSGVKEFESNPKNLKQNNSNSKFVERKKWLYREISIEIGKKWRDFGRGINLREGEMDDLEINCKGIEERVYKMLAKLEENEFYNSDVIYYRIIKSLEENCNRRKFSDKIKRAMIK